MGFFTPPNRNQASHGPTSGAGSSQSSHGYQRPMSPGHSQATTSSSPTQSHAYQHTSGQDGITHHDQATLKKEGTFNRSAGAEQAKGESMKLEYVRQQRIRQEKEKLKNELTQKQRTFNHNKTEISAKELEIRRLQSEFTRSEIEVQQIDSLCNDLDSKIAVQKNKVHTAGDEIQKLQIQLAKLKSEQEKLGIQLQHWTSERQYKDKTKEQKHVAREEIVKKKTNFIQVVDQLRAENVRLDREIRMLESKIRLLH